MSFETSLAARAALAGWTLGSPRNGRSDFQRVSGYDPIPVRMAPSHPLEVWVAWSKHLELGKPPELLAETVDRHVRLNHDESTFGFRNIRNGFSSPLSGSYCNIRPTGSEAVLRAAYWGLAWHGDPDTAARYAYYDASLDHAGDGVWIPVAVAVTVASCRPGQTSAEAAQVFTNALPSASKVHKVHGEIRRVASLADGAREFRLRSINLLEEPDLTDAVHSGAHILLALQSGQGDTGKTMLTATSCGGATAHTTAVVGMVTTLLSGAIAEEWTSPVGTDYVGSFVLRDLESPAKVAEWVSLVSHVWTPQPSVNSEPEATESVAEEVTSVEAASLTHSEDQSQIAPVDPKSTETPEPDVLADPVTADPATAQTTGEAIEPAKTAPQPAEPTESEIDQLMAELEAEAKTAIATPIGSSLTDKTQQLLTSTPNSTSFISGETLVQVRYLNRPFAVPTMANELQFEFSTLADEPRNVELALESPAGWEIATKMTACALRPGETAQFAAIAKPTTEQAAESPRISLKIDGIATVIPMARALPWMVAAPFFNADGLGYEKPYPPENGFDIEQYMNGRSDMPVKWQKEYFPGNVYDLEPFFKHGPGVAYLYSEVEFEKPGLVTVLAAVDTGLKLWADGKRILAYHDKRKPILRAEGQYGGSFMSSGPTRLIVKVLRNNEPVQPLILVFYDEDGAVITPIRQTP